MSENPTAKDGGYVTIPFSDYADLVENNLRSSYTSMENPITGLPNGRGLLKFWGNNQRSLERNRESTNSSTKMMTVIYGDLEKFKPINEEFGYKVGDQLLIKVGQVLVNQTRPGEMVGNPHGDEYILLLKGNSEAAETVKKRIKVAVQKIRLTARTKQGKIETIRTNLKLKHKTVSARDSLQKILDEIDEEFFDSQKEKEQKLP